MLNCALLETCLQADVADQPLDPRETWLSGRKRLTANEVGSKSPPGFESLRLRK